MIYSVKYSLKELIATFLVVFSTVTYADTPCYPVDIHIIGASYGEVVLGNKKLSGFAAGSPAVMTCGDVPDRVETRLFLSDRDPVVRTVDLKPKMPKGFLTNRARRIVFYVSEEASKVAFRVRLSDVTTKELEQTESDSEALQRHWDEQLWLGIKSQSSKQVKNALLKGANTKQPWMGYTKGTDYKSVKYTVFKAALSTRNIEMLDLILSAGVSFPDFEIMTALWQRPVLTEEEGRKLFSVMRESEFVGGELARVLLEHGANPNYGRTLKFKWHTKDAAFQWKYSNIDRPYDRLLYIAANEGDIELLNLLVEFGAETEFYLPAKREPPGWWDEGELFLDWIERKADPSVKDVLLGTYK